MSGCGFAILKIRYLGRAGGICFEEDLFQNSWDIFEFSKNDN